MTEDKPKGTYPNRHFDRANTFKGNPPVDVDAIRAETGLAPLPASARTEATLLPSVTPTVTKRRSITQTVGDDDAAVKEYIRSRGTEIVDRLLGLALDDGVKHNISLAACVALLDRGYGKPTQTTETTETIADMTALHLDAVRSAVKK